MHKIEGMASKKKGILLWNQNTDAENQKASSYHLREPERVRLGEGGERHLFLCTKGETHKDKNH